MAELSVTKDDILRSTLFHIQINRCEYIDDFPEAVSEVFDKMIDENGMPSYKKLKRNLYKIDTSFFSINKGKTKKKDFYEGLYERIERKTE